MNVDTSLRLCYDVAMRATESVDNGELFTVTFRVAPSMPRDVAQRGKKVTVFVFFGFLFFLVFYTYVRTYGPTTGRELNSWKNYLPYGVRYGPYGRESRTIMKNKNYNFTLASENQPWNYRLPRLEVTVRTYGGLRYLEQC